MFLRLVLFLFVALWTACGASSAPAASGSYHGAERTMLVSESSTRSAQVRPDGASLAPAPAVQRASLDAMPAEMAGGEPPPARSDATSAGPILIYTGTVQLSIFSVGETQARIVALIEEMGGYVSDRGSHRLVVRVPAEQFRDALERIAEQGDVLQLDWRAQDVSEQYTDLQIRLRNATEMRLRLEALLVRAEKVEDLLRIEEQLRRITLEIEQLTGQMRALNDRIAYSTITITFAARQPQQLPGSDFRLPFQFLQSMGLRPLMNLR